MPSLRRTVLALAALCAGALALAIGVNAAVERADPAVGGVPPVRFLPAPIPRLDVHQHSTPRTGAESLRLARAHGIGALVNWSGGVAGDGLEESLAAAAAPPGRIFVLMNVDGRGCCAGGWAEREAARLAAGQAEGARGLALPGALGERGEVPLDARALDPLFDACERLRLPVFVHSAEPGPLERRASRHRGLPFVAAGFAGAADDPARVAALLDRLPNLHVDTAALDRLGRAPAAARAAILAHPDRVLLGTDVRLVEIGDVKAVVFGGGDPGGRAEMLRFFDGTWRFFETRDRDIPAPVGEGGDLTIEGIGLPRRVLEQVYHRNAERLLGVALPDDP